MRSSGKLKIIECDGIGCRVAYAAPFHPSQIKANIMLAKRDGWRVRHIKGLFYHLCPRCDEVDETRQ